MEGEPFVYPTMLLAAAVLCTPIDVVSLGLNRRVGDVRRYDVKNRVEVKGSGPIEVTSTLTVKVTQADARGFETDDATSNTLVRFGGQSTPQSDLTVHRAFLATGEISKITTTNVDADSYRRQLATLLYVPRRDYKMGEKWSLDVPANRAWGTPRVTIDFQFVGRDAQGVHVLADAKEREGAKPIKCRTEFWLDGDGWATRIKFTLDNLPLRDVDRVAKVTTEYVGVP